MKTLNVMLSNLGGRVVPIGYEGENLYTRIRINCIEVFADYPDATVSMVVNSPVGQMYPAVIEKSGVMVIWDITDAVLSSNGSGECQLTFTDGDVVRKSVVFGISINRSLIASGDPPEPVQEWIDKADQTAQEIAENAANLAKEDIVESYGSIAPAIIETASGAIASFSDGADGMLVKTMNVDIDPVQDLHGYDNSWPGGGGKNKLPPFKSGKWVLGSTSAYYAIKSSDNAPTFPFVYETTGQTSYNDVPVYVFNCVPNTAYTITPPTGLKVVVAEYASISDISNRNNAIARWSDSGTSQVGALSNTTQSATNYLVIGFSNYGGSNNISVNDEAEIMLESGSIATEYAPFENVCPISGWTSADVTRTKERLISDSDMENGGINANNGNNQNNSARIRSAQAIQITKGSYLVTAEGMGKVNVYKYNLQGTFTGYNGWNTLPYTFVASEDMQIRIIMGKSDDSNITVADASNVSFAENGEIYTYTFPQSAGTVYGAKLTIHQDGTGTLLVKRAEDDLGARNWTVSADNISFLSSSRPSGDIVPSSQSEMPKVICDIYRPSPIIDQLDMSIAIATSGKFKIRDSRFSQPLDATAFKTAMNGVKAVYELAEPVSYDLTAQQVVSLLKGQNVLWADCGDVSLEYPADTKLYIDARVAELQALILENISNS